MQERGDEPLDDHQNPLVLIGEIIGADTIEADDGDNLFIENYRHRNLTFDGSGNFPIQAPVALFLVGIGNHVGPADMGDVTGKTAFLGRQLLAADPNRRNVLFQPFLTFGSDQTAVSYNFV